MPGREGSVAGDRVQHLIWDNTPRRAPGERRTWVAALVTALVLVGVAGFALWHRRPAWMVVLPAVAAAVVPFLMLRGGGRAVRWVEGLASGVRSVLVTLLFGLLAVPLVLVPAVVGRVVPGRTPDTDGRWTPAPRRLGTPEAAWSNDLHLRPSPSRMLAVALVVLASGVVVLWFMLNPRQGPQGFELRAPVDTRPARHMTAPIVELREPVPDGLEADHPDDPHQLAALDDDPWYVSPSHRTALSFVVDQRYTRFENPYRMLDMASRHVNVVDGRRTTWQPPGCVSCSRPVVWFYGGSTTFGLGQRDEHTIPSELARVAHANGIDLEVHNRGVLGFNHWQESERFAWDLASEPAPDLVIFYDGVNELHMIRDPDHSWNGKDSPVDTHLVGLWKASGRQLHEQPDPPAGARYAPPPYPDGDVVWKALDTVARYDRAREMSGATAAAAGVPTRYVWQPSRYDRGLVEGEPHWGGDEENAMRLLTQVAGDELPSDVIDLTDALDRTRGPLFTDDVHHDERAARVIARAMFRQLRADLASIGG